MTRKLVLGLAAAATLAFAALAPTAASAHGWHHHHGWHGGFGYGLGVGRFMLAARLRRLPAAPPHHDASRLSLADSECLLLIRTVREAAFWPCPRPEGGFFALQYPPRRTVSDSVSPGEFGLCRFTPCVNCVSCAPLDTHPRAD